MKRNIKNRDVNRTVTMQKQRKQTGTVDQEAPITLMRHAGLFIKTICMVVTVAFLGLTLQPLAMAAHLPSHQAPAPKEASNEEKLAKQLETIEAKLEKLETKLTAKQDTKTDEAELKTLRKDLDSLDQTAIDDFNKIEKHLKDKKLPQVILDRHAEAVKTYSTEMATLKANLDALDKESKDENKLPKAKVAKDYLKAKQKKKAYTPVDPNNLPFGVPDAKKTRKPAEKKEDFQKFGLLQEERIQLAAAELLPGMLLQAALLAAPGAADLQPTDDVQITPDIQALATRLDRNPVKIYNWVHNNINFVPTYGSIQGSQMCLETAQCNAFDTASLLIALLRASNIPARYVYGTIQVPAEKAMNWVGGTTKPEAAQQVLGQGGIPNTGLVAGGKITHIKLEHVWVEAFVDFSPSRGAVSRQGDGWVPMDGSFKQYQHIQGMDIKNNVPFDAESFANQARASAQVNEQEGWASSINLGLAQTAFADYDARVRAHIQNTKPDATAADIVGKKVILQKNGSVLAAGLPYKTVATGSRFASIPDNLRHKFQFNLYAGALEQSLDSPTLVFSENLVKLAGKRITLSFAAAGSADADLLDSYLPQPHSDGSPILRSELPTSLPGYLIRARAELRVDGVVVASGGDFTLGQELISTAGMFDPSRGWEYTDPNQPVAGEYHGLAINYGTVSYAQLARIQQNLQSTIARLGADDLTGLDKDAVVGEKLYAVALAYFRQCDDFSNASAYSAGVLSYRKPSFGEFFATVNTVFWFGLPRSVTVPGYTMDISRSITITVAKDDSLQTRFSFLQHSGYLSSLFEGMVPANIFKTPQGMPDGVSASRALAQATSTGQRIYQITASNVNAQLGQLNVDANARQEIANAVAAGKAVTVSQQPVTIDGWTGSGYVILDPVSGSSAYKISGGANGGVMSDKQSTSVGILEILLGLFGATKSVKRVGHIAIHGLEGINTFFQSLAAGCNFGEAATIAFIQQLIVYHLVHALTSFAWGFLGPLTLGLGSIVLLIVVIYVIYLIVHWIAEIIQTSGEFMCKWRQEHGG